MPKLNCETRAYTNRKSAHYMIWRMVTDVFSINASDWNSASSGSGFFVHSCRNTRVAMGTAASWLFVQVWRLFVMPYQQRDKKSTSIRDSNLVTSTWRILTFLDLEGICTICTYIFCNMLYQWLGVCFVSGHNKAMNFEDNKEWYL